MQRLITLMVVAGALALAIVSGAAAGGLPLSPHQLAPPGGGGWPAGCRDIDVSTSQSSFLFQTQIYRFHAIEHWCWSGGAIYEERHGWSFDGSSTACLDTVYGPNAWFYTWWNGIPTSGHFTEERAHVTNCLFHIGDWKELYPDVKIWIHADGSYTSDTAN